MLINLCCPVCNTNNFRQKDTYLTQNNGERRVFECLNCNSYFSETSNTPIMGLRTPISFIATVLTARVEGLSQNATARTFNLSKNTVRDWENRFSSIFPVLKVYALANNFIKQVIEGDELYTKVNKNTDPLDSEGWTVVFLERASRFIWVIECGRKDKILFESAINQLSEIISKTQDLTLLTDGERRYGSILFEICNELLDTGKPGRPKKTLKKGVKIRLKNKGNQSKKRGRKRQKYEAPCPEHPETKQDIENNEIHADHVEAQNAANRRRLSPYRRKTNTYAKSKKGLQRVCNMYWIFHNFVKKHFTTKIVPAVALGVIKQGLSIADIFHLQKPSNS